MRKLVKSAGKFVSGAFLCGAILFGGAASAAPNDEGMAAFREAISATAKPETRIFREDVLFITPSAQGELDFIGSTEGNTFKAAGNLAFWLNSSSGEDVDLKIPFYITQVGNEMKLYYETDKKWKVITAPLAAANAIDYLATPTPEQLEEIISNVKEVTILQDSDSRRTMLVKLDGNKIADSVKAEIEKQSAENPVAGFEELQNKVTGYIDSGIRNADVWYMWTIDKTNWQTVTMSYNLSGLIQGIARAVLRDADSSLDNRLVEILEDLSFYSELKVYSTYLEDSAKQRLEIPKKVLKAKPVEDKKGSSKK